MDSSSRPYTDEAPSSRVMRPAPAALSPLQRQQPTSSNAVNDAFLAFHNSRMVASSTASMSAEHEGPPFDNGAHAGSQQLRPRQSSADIGNINETRGIIQDSHNAARGRHPRRGGHTGTFGHHNSNVNGTPARAETDQHDFHGHMGMDRGRGGRGGTGRGGIFERGRGFDHSHGRGRGRGAFAPDRHRPNEEAHHHHHPGHDRGHRHPRGDRGSGFRGGGPAHARGGGYVAAQANERGRGGYHYYDADFDRGKSAQDRKAEAHKQLYQAPMGYSSDRPEGTSQRQSSSAARRNKADGPRKSLEIPALHERQEQHSSSDGPDQDHAEAERQEDGDDDAHTSPEPAHRPGIITTGIDLAAVKQSSRKSKSEKRDRHRRREGRDGHSGRDSDRDQSAAVGHHGMNQQPPPPPFAGGGPPPPPHHHYDHGPPPFPYHGPPPPHPPPGMYHGQHPPPPPPPPGGFHPPPHHGRPPPPGGHWPPPPHPFDSPPHRPRAFPEDRSRIPPGSGAERRDGRPSKRERLLSSAKAYDSASNRDNASRDGHDRSSVGYSSPVPAPRQLFDPFKHDPVKFSLQKAANSSVSQLASDTRSVASSATQRSSATSLSVASSDYRSRYSGRSDALLDEVESTASGAGSNALLRELKSSYREIMNVEAKLQDEDSYAKTALEELKAKNDAHGDDVSVVKEVRPDEYWAKLIQLHRDGAEAFHSFMERCMDPMIPASIHSIPQKYNLPSRMWKSAFLLLFERLRHALPSQDLAKPDGSAGNVNDESVGNVSEHLTDFIYYAYTFYTQLLEQQSLSVFRGTWIEQLGDIARYRMEVAQISSQASGTHERRASQPSGRSLKALLEGADGQDSTLAAAEIPAGNEAHRQNRKQLVSRKDRKKGFMGLPAKIGADMEIADTPGNSIGAAALDDWELVEHETWRTVARDWYFLGLSETTGTGRLHHHLASMAQEDELRTLYHFAKSAIASHPYAAGSGSIMAFFASSKQALRIQPDASALSLFIHLHGLLYTRTDVDTFEPILGRLEEKLEETFAYAKAQADRPPRRSVRGKERDDPSQRLNRDSTWIMMAVISISSIMEFGREGGVLKAVLAKAQDQKKSEKQSNKAEKKANARSDPTPSEASLNDLAMRLERLEVENAKGKSAERDSHAVLPTVPYHLRLAMRLAIILLRDTLQHPMKPGEEDPAICPYITIFLTFMSTLAHNSGALAVLRSAVPWEDLVAFFNQLPTYAKDAYLGKESSVPNRLLGIPLPEDWCIRGLEWTGKQLFGRGYWKGKLGTAYMTVSQSEGPGDGSKGEAIGYSMPESEKDVLSERYEGPSMPAHAGGPQNAIAGQGDEHQLDEDGDPPTDRETVARLRWKRVALTAAWLARAVPFMSVTEEGRVSFDKTLYESITAKDIVEDSLIKPKTAQAKVDADLNARSANEATSDDDEDDYLLGDGDESETVRELKARRRELKALLRESRESRNNKKQETLLASESTQSKRSTRASINALAGYTTFVFDTNVLLEAMDIFTTLLTSKRWSLVVPLAVVTELDGLRTKEDNLGSSATQAIKFLEDAIKTYSTNLKVQTSRGNYLRDLNIRREDIDFGHSSSSSAMGGLNSATDGTIKSMDDVILNIAMWQKTNWLDRRALLGIKTSASPTEKSTAPAKTILVSSDRTLRLKGKARGLDVCDASSLQHLLEQPPNG